MSLNSAVSSHLMQQPIDYVIIVLTKRFNSFLSQEYGS